MYETMMRNTYGLKSAGKFLDRDLRDELTPLRPNSSKMRDLEKQKYGDSTPSHQAYT